MQTSVSTWTMDEHGKVTVDKRQEEHWEIVLSTGCAIGNFKSKLDAIEYWQNNKKVNGKMAVAYLAKILVSVTQEGIL